MVYRAKVTHVLEWIEQYYPKGDNTYVRDAKDIYLELPDCHAAEMLEAVETQAKITHEMQELWLQENNIISSVWNK